MREFGQDVRKYATFEDDAIAGVDIPHLSNTSGVREQAAEPGLERQLKESFPDSDRPLREKNRGRHIEVPNHKIEYIPTEQAPLSCCVGTDSAISVPETTDLITKKQYWCVVLPMEHNGRRMLAHIPPNNNNRNSLGYECNFVTEHLNEEEKSAAREEGEREVSKTVDKIVELLGGDITGAKGVLFVNIASENPDSDKGNMHFEYQTKIWQRLRNKLAQRGAQIGIVESPMYETSVYFAGNSREIILTGNKAVNDQRLGTVVPEDDVVQSKINFDEACQKISVLPHVVRTVPDHKLR